ncbi:MAG TPA: 5-oxoprolinase/urea amidolyase family protein [Mycobacteriales bacterium]|nr:5-oxoprolinase/urea amidolyase family protein [Mycobacteriales bacterium]
MSATLTGRGSPPEPLALQGISVVKPGIQTTVQDLAGRRGLWSVGVPPSGAWDDLSFALAARAVGNDAFAAGLEAVVQGPVLSFAERALICVAGAATHATVDGRAVVPGQVTVVPAGGVLDMGRFTANGLRGYLAVRGGLDVPRALGSRSTFLLGGFGGLHGRALVAGDVLGVRGQENCAAPRDVHDLLPTLHREWVVRVIAGPHGGADHLTPEGLDELFAATWEVDHRADRTGVRLVGPAPQWSRADGGDAGLHPSNIHDSAYPVGAIMLSGGTPVVVGPDGPSLGGFLVPAVVIESDRWIFAQARPGDTVRLEPITPADADRINANRRALLRDGVERTDLPATRTTTRPAPLAAIAADGERPALVVRRAGDHHLLVEVGPPELDLEVRFRVHLLADAITAKAPAGITEQVEGVRSILVATDSTRLGLPALAAVVADAWAGLPDPHDVVLPVREVTLPLALDDPAAHEAMQRYQRTVRPDAPWCPDNVEFIRRVNGLDARDDVFDIVTRATYVVVGLGDVYLGAPVAVPLDPAHRLVTTKYDPARTWTPANAVGIGGIYLCIYGMEGPGGYQLVGRTVPVWRYDPEGVGPPWLLRPFDRLRFVPVTPEELLDLRADVLAGRRDLDTNPATLTLADFGTGGADFTARRQRAFADERARWEAAR